MLFYWEEINLYGKPIVNAFYIISLKETALKMDIALSKRPRLIPSSVKVSKQRLGFRQSRLTFVKNMSLDFVRMCSAFYQRSLVGLYQNKDGLSKK